MTSSSEDDQECLTMLESPRTRGTADVGIQEKFPIRLVYGPNDQLKMAQIAPKDE